MKMENHMNEEFGQIVLNEVQTVADLDVHLRVKKAKNGYVAEWSFDGETWGHLTTHYCTPKMALVKAAMGAWIAQLTMGES
jgi:hypothetical protein